MEKRHTKPYGTLKETLRIGKIMVKTNSPQNKSGMPIPKAPELIYFDEVTEFTMETYKKLLRAQSKGRLKWKRPS